MTSKYDYNLNEEMKEIYVYESDAFNDDFFIKKVREGWRVILCIR
jgi:hypothetical protein